jgi:2-polyprenyl-3-methyl-5-hydroxy-6-metoxy-1,4-benzoquinol methylase
MDHGPQRRIVQKAMSECLVRIRRCGERSEGEFAEAVGDLPPLLRELADALENPPAGMTGRIEAPGLKGYSLWADTYDEEGNPVVAGEESVIWDLIGPASGLRVLDVGCGTGRHAIPLAAQGAEVIASDPTTEMLQLARGKAEAAGVEVDLRAGGVDDLGAALGQFDLVLCCLVLSHVADIEGVVSRLARYVGPRGRLIISDFHPTNLLLGFRTAFTSQGTKYVVPNYLHLVSDYFGALAASGLSVTHLLEPGRWPDLPDIPTTLVIEARRQKAEEAKEARA